MIVERVVSMHPAALSPISPEVYHVWLSTLLVLVDLVRTCRAEVD
jgi:hypothetical protein